MRARARSALVWADWILLAPGVLGAVVVFGAFSSGWYLASPVNAARMGLIAAFPLVDIACLMVAAPIAGRPLVTGRAQAVVLATSVAMAALVLVMGLAV